MRLTTQVYVWVDGEQKVVEHFDAQKVSRQLMVDIQLHECYICKALLYPDIKIIDFHHNWHKELSGK